jgi:hypothetical protein
MSHKYFQNELSQKICFCFYVLNIYFNKYYTGEQKRVI